MTQLDLQTKTIDARMQDFESHAQVIGFMLELYVAVFFIFIAGLFLMWWNNKTK